MTVEDIHQKLSLLAFSGMEDDYYVANRSVNQHSSSKSHKPKTDRRRLRKEFSIQLSLFD